VLLPQSPVVVHTPEQQSWPVEHAVAQVPQCAGSVCRLNVSSVTPLQSSSTPLQVSVLGFAMLTQTSAAPLP
jgi:hypothetical protein